MALPTPPPYTNPIPNNPFSYPLNPYVCGPYFPIAVGAGIDITTGATVPKLVNEVQDVLAAGPGIALTTFLGVTTITATGGGGGGIPCSLITAKGDMIVGTAANTPTALPVGATDGHVLTVCAACAEGVTWAAGGGGGATPATPTAEGIVYGCTDAVNFNYGLGDGILSSLTTGILNIAVGGGALATTDAGTSNTAIGIGALYSNTSGNQNVALGQQALFAGTTGGLNVAVGSQALQNATGDANTAIGNFAGSTVTSGSKNIIIGHNGAPDTPVYSVTTEDNRVVMGTTAITNAYIQVAWSAVSDARDKTNITALPVGLEFVKQLNPVSYQFKESRDSEVPHGPVRYGFLAQEILAAEGENPVIVDTEDPEKLKVTNDYMNAIFVKAIQELSAKVEALEAKLEANG